jgi:double-stranded uracil-DNA glycosylase
VSSGSHRGANQPSNCRCKGGLDSRWALIRYDADILSAGLDGVFCGLNPAISATISGHNFSNPSNRFWEVMHLAGFTHVRLRPENERRLLEFGYGLTAAVGRPTHQAIEVLPEEFERCRSELETKLRRFAPRAIAFLGKRALSTMIHEPNLNWGKQPNDFAGISTWVLPNTSGLNRGFPLPALVKAFSEFRRSLA